MSHPYPSDLTDEEWVVLEPFITPGKQADHPQVLGLRRIVDGTFYLLRTGCQRWAMPHEFPPRTAVFYRYAKWRSQGTWDPIDTALQERHCVAHGRKLQTTVAIINSQSARTTEAGGPGGDWVAQAVEMRCSPRTADRCEQVADGAGKAVELDND